MPGPVIWFAAAWYLVLSIGAFVAFALDKRAARRGEWRMRERTLLGLAFLGGFAGAWTGMRATRHKTRKWSFRLLVPLAGVLHAAAWVAAWVLLRSA